MYDVMLNDIVVHPTILNWASQVKNLLELTGFNYVWLNQGVENCNTSAFINIFNQRVKDLFIQNWKEELIS